MKSEKPRRIALRQRLLLFLVIPLSVLLAISVAYDYETSSDPADAAFDHTLGDDAIALLSRIKVDERGLVYLDLSPTEEALIRLDGSDIEFLSVWGPDGKLLRGDADLIPEPVDVDRGLVLTNSTLRGKKIRKASYRQDTSAGMVMLAVGETTRKRDQATSHILTAMIVPNLLFIVATLLVVYFGVRRGLVPLNQLGEEIARRSPHDLSPLPDTEVPLEAEPLVKAMSNLMNDLRAANAAQHAFLADAAHQLRTPLAGLQTQLELAAAELPPEHRERIVRLRDGTQRLAHLTHQLLALARSGPEANLIHEFRQVSLERLLERCASQWYDVSLARRIDLGFEAEAATVEGSPWMLNELLGNLIDNALNYTPAEGQVTVRSGIDGEGRPFLEVEDNGSGIPESERSLVFERFYRAGNRSESGSGLGLSIVKEVADRHGASIELESNQLGTSIRVRFPGNKKFPAGQSSAKS